MMHLRITVFILDILHNNILVNKININDTRAEKESPSICDKVIYKHTQNS